MRCQRGRAFTSFRMCALRLGNDDGAGMPEVDLARDHDFATTQNLYGLFATGKSVLEKLRTIVNAQRLCAAVSGLEKLLRGRACFARQLSRCLGACVGEETLQNHQARLR